MHPVFHISLLKKSIAADLTTQPLPSFLSESWELQVQPEEVLAVRQNEQGEYGDFGQMEAPTTL